MDTAVKIFSYNNIPPYLIDFVHQNQFDLSKGVLNIEVNDFHTINSLLEELPSELPKHILHEIYETLEAWNLFDEFDESRIYDLESLEHLMTTRDLLEEQDIYLNSIKTYTDNGETITRPRWYDCQVYYIVAYLNEVEYGSIFAFWNEDQPDIVFIQAITKFLIPTLISLSVPKSNKLLPKLNEMLDLSIKLLAKRLGAKRILVAPIGKQGAILEKYYGYRRTEEQYFPCVDIWKPKQFDGWYQKTI